MLVKDAVAQYPPLPFLALRFALALLLMAVAVRRLPDRRLMLVGVSVGLALAAGYVFQTLGLQRTSPGNAGLITGLFVVFTPLLERLFGRHVPPRTLLALVISLLGIVLLTGGPQGFNFGDLLVLGCAIAFALHITLLGRWAPDLPPAPLAMVQMGTAALLFTGATFIPGAGGLSRPPAAILPAIAVTGAVASALGFFIQTWAQTQLTASRTALILASEPAWALLAAIVLAGQRLGALQAFGAALVLVAVVGHEAAGAAFARQGAR